MVRASNRPRANTHLCTLRASRSINPAGHPQPTPSLQWVPNGRSGTQDKLTTQRHGKPSASACFCYPSPGLAACRKGQLPGPFVAAASLDAPTPTPMAAQHTSRTPKTSLFPLHIRLQCSAPTSCWALRWNLPWATWQHRPRPRSSSAGEAETSRCISTTPSCASLVMDSRACVLVRCTSACVRHVQRCPEGQCVRAQQLSLRQNRGRGGTEGRLLRYYPTICRSKRCSPALRPSMLVHVQVQHGSVPLPMASLGASDLHEPDAQSSPRSCAFRSPAYDGTACDTWTAPSTGLRAQPSQISTKATEPEQVPSAGVQCGLPCDASAGTAGFESTPGGGPAGEWISMNGSALPKPILLWHRMMEKLRVPTIDRSAHMTVLYNGCSNMHFLG